MEKTSVIAKFWKGIEATKIGSTKWGRRKRQITATINIKMKVGRKRFSKGFFFLKYFTGVNFFGIIDNKILMRIKPTIIQNYQKMRRIKREFWVVIEDS